MNEDVNGIDFSIEIRLLRDTFLNGKYENLFQPQQKYTVNFE